MRVLGEEYLKNTRRVYNDFCKLSDNYVAAKDYIDNISIRDMSRYRDIILAEHEMSIKNDEIVLNFLTTVLLSALVSALVSTLVTLLFANNDFVIPFVVGMLFVVILFLAVNWNFIGNTMKRQRYINISVMIGYLKSK